MGGTLLTVVLFCLLNGSYQFKKSCHPWHINKVIPYNQGLRYPRICLEDYQFRDRIGKLIMRLEICSFLMNLNTRMKTRKEIILCTTIILIIPLAGSCFILVMTQVWVKIFEIWICPVTFYVIIKKHGNVIILKNLIIEIKLVHKMISFLIIILVFR